MLRIFFLNHPKIFDNVINRQISVPIPTYKQSTGSYSQNEMPHTKQPGMRINLGYILAYSDKKKKTYTLLNYTLARPRYSFNRKL